MAGQDRLYLGMKGHVACLSKEGEELWRTRLKGSGFVNVVVEPDGIFAYTRGSLYALDAATGRIRWTNDLPKLGFDTCVIASANQTTVAAHAIRAAQAAAAANSGGAGQ